LKLLARLLLLLVVILGLSVAVSLRTFRAFTEEELVAVVRCETAPAGATYGFLVEVTQMRAGEPGRREKFPMVGDQWTIGGDLLKWKPWLTWLGAKPCHKLTRLSSRYLQAERERSLPRTAYDLNGGTSAFWRWLYRWGVLLPFVDAVYGNASHVPVRIGARWGVYVTHSGYFIRSLRERGR